MTDYSKDNCRTVKYTSGSMYPKILHTDRSWYKKECAEHVANNKANKRGCIIKRYKNAFTPSLESIIELHENRIIVE